MSSTPIGAAMVGLASGHYPVPVLYGADGRQLTTNTVNGPLSIGPGMPLPPRIDTVPTYPPREYQYTPQFNLYPAPRQEGGQGYPFAQLRAWAKLCHYFRVATEYREKQLRSRSFKVVPAEDSKNPKAYAKYEAEIKRCSRFITKPNRVDRGLTFSTWIGQAVEECFVTDALVFHKQYHRSGDLSYVQINGETIKILIDEWGHNVGYQQILWGYPATQYGEGTGETYEPGEMAYWIYKPRVDSSYGTSPLEEILPIILTAIKRAQAQLDWYTEGTVPDAFMTAPEGWTSEQISKYQLWMDNELNDSRSRRRARMVPHGTVYTATKPFAYTKDEEEAIASIVLAYMGVPKMVLVAQVNRGEADAQQKDSADVGLVPFVTWWEENLTAIIQEDLGAPDLKVICSDGLEGQNEATTKRQVMLIGAGVLTPDEARAEIGKEPLTDESEGSDDRVGIDPSLIQRAFLEAGVITRDELRATIGLPPAKEGGEQYITIGAFGATAPDAMEEAAAAPKVPPALAPFAGKTPPLGGQDGKPAENTGPAVAGGSGGASADDLAGVGAGGDQEADDEPPAAKSERAAWRRFALARFDKGRHTSAFRADALGEPAGTAIRAALRAARTRDDVAQAFEKAKKRTLTTKVKAKAIGEIKSAAKKWFDAEYGAAMKVAREKLAGNVDEA